MTYRLLKILGWIVLRLSARRRLRLAKFLGLIAWQVLSPKRKRIAVDSIRETLNVSLAEARQIAKKSVTRFGKLLIDMLGYPALSRDNIERLVRIQGLKNLDDALALGKGVVMATGHFGNWELLGAGLAFLGYPIVGVTKQQRQNAGFDRFLREYRTMSGGWLLDTTDVRKVIRALRENKIAFILFDNEIQENGVWVEFLGRATSTPPGAAILAHITGSPIIPAFITETADGTHDLQIYPPITVDQSGDKAVAAHDGLQQLSRLLEQRIRECPHEWLWIHDRWRPLKVKRASLEKDIAQ